MKFNLANGVSMEVDNKSEVQLLSKDSHPVHWGWWVGWALLFWPALLIVALISCFRKKYVVKVDGVVLILDENNYQLLLKAMNETPKFSA